MNPNLFQTHCTWKAVDGKNITEAVTWTDANENSDIEETIQAENCILLESSGKSGVSTECSISLLCRPPYVIQQVAVLCEARLVEVYGQHQEYLRTLRCEMVDEMDDMIVFRAEVKFDKPAPECSLKFTGLKSKTSMWLYGVVAYVSLPQPSTNVLLSAAQRFSSQHALPDRSQLDGQMMAFMSLMGQPKTPVEQPPQTQQFSPFAHMYGQTPNNRMIPQQSFQMPPVAPQMDPTLNQVLTNSQLPNKPETNANVPEMATPNQLPPAQMPPELAHMLQLINSPNALNMMSDLLQKMQNEKAEAGKQSVAQNNNNVVPEVVVQDTADEMKTQEEKVQDITPALPSGQPEAGTQAAQENTTSAQEQPAPVAAPPPPPAVAPVTPAVKMPPLPPPARIVAEPLSEAVAVSKLSGGAVEQISESVVTNMECSLEHLEERLWGKVRHRLQEMENKIINRLDEMFDALREEVESETRDLQEELEDEEESLSMGPEGSVLQI